MALKDIKSKITATKRMNTVTRAMEAVSAVKMRKTQARAFEGRAYARAALAILSRVSGVRELKEQPLAQAGKGTKLGLIVVTSDKGLAGGLNASVLKQALERARAYAPENVEIYAYGKKGQEFFASRGYQVIESFENKLDLVPHEIAEQLTHDLAARFTDGVYAEVCIAYTNLKSTFEQLATVRVLLPLTVESVQGMVRDILPVRGQVMSADETPVPASYTTEQTETHVIDTLMPKLLAISIYHFLLESKASEHSARMVAMKNASDKSKQVAKDLTRVYNKIRQAAITREVSEIVSGREALAA